MLIFVERYFKGSGAATKARVSCYIRPAEKANQTRPDLPGPSIKMMLDEAATRQAILTVSFSLINLL